MSINFGTRLGADCLFSDPTPLLGWQPPELAGVYGVCISDHHATPLPYAVIYFGQSGNLAERGFPRTHHAFHRWIEYGGSENALFIACLPLPRSTESQRKAIEGSLIARYDPVCNRTSTQRPAATRPYSGLLGLGFAAMKAGEPVRGIGEAYNGLLGLGFAARPPSRGLLDTKLPTGLLKGLGLAQGAPTGGLLDSDLPTGFLTGLAPRRRF